MSTYVRHKVLRIPWDKVNMSSIYEIIKEKHQDDDIFDDLSWYLETDFPELFKYSRVGYFQQSPTCRLFLDYMIDYEYDADGEYGKTRALYDCEKEKYLPIFQQIDPNIDMNLVQLVEYCWYNGCEAYDYYDDTEDPFYEPV